GRDAPGAVGVGREAAHHEPRRRESQQPIERSDREEAAFACARSYRDQMAEFSAMNAVDVWYASFEAESLIEDFQCPRHPKHLPKRLAKAKERSAFEHDFPKLVHVREDRPAIREHPPTIYHWREHGREHFADLVHAALDAYRGTLPTERRVLIDR